MAVTISASYHVWSSERSSISIGHFFVHRTLKMVRNVHPDSIVSLIWTDVLDGFIIIWSHRMLTQSYPTSLLPNPHIMDFGTRKITPLIFASSLLSFMWPKAVKSVIDRKFKVILWFIIRINLKAVIKIFIASTQNIRQIV